MTAKTELPFDKEYIRTFSEEMGEPSWLTEMRLQALENMDTLPLPKPDKTKIDHWDFERIEKHMVESKKYTSLEDLPEEVKALITLEDEDRNLFIQRNNQPSLLFLTKEIQEKGVIFVDIFTAVRQHGNLLEKYLMREGVRPDEHRLAALHAALINGGIFLYVPRNVEVKSPIQAVFIHDRADANLFNHVLIVAEENSSVTYVENYISTIESAKGVFNIVTEVIARENAHVRYGAVDTVAKGITTYVNRRGVAGKDARIEWSLGMMNDGDTIFDNTTNLIGDGSYGDTKTVVIGRGDQTENFTTKVVHFGKYTEGFILNHGIVKDQATIVFNGIGKIEHGATKSNAEQKSRLLMLSEHARGDANPILLIDEDDVMAGHAASVGRVDPVQLYYLMSRGIPREDAVRLIIHGFLAPVVTELPIEGVRKQLDEIIERKVK